ncbi:upstream stimulatory factor 1-like isoform X1 [Planococcus citri]|uniref:upstream stimulatory factor 1-like isoform X1 n=2 Tax=Planococcus citri TaxID=170843 RepID=UPI0031F967B7
MDMIDLNLENGDVKVCPDDLIAEKDFMEAQTLIVEEDGSLGSTDDQNVNDLSTADALLDTAGEDDVDLQYQFRSNEGVTYRVVQVSGALSTDNESTLPHTIISATPSLSSPQQIQTVFTNPLNGQLYVIGSTDDVYPKTNNHKPIAPRTSSVIESIRNPGISRDDRRRATHNEVERRRRDKINNWIMKLSKIVPECHSDTSKGYDVQQSKGGILAKACDYITELRESNQRLMNVLKENEQVTAELVKLKSINEALSNENDELRSVLKQNGLITRYHK